MLNSAIDKDLNISNQVSQLPKEIFDITYPSTFHSLFFLFLFFYYFYLFVLFKLIPQIAKDQVEKDGPKLTSASVVLGQYEGRLAAEVIIWI